MAKQKHKKVYGVGINDADYLVTQHFHSKIKSERKLLWTCPIYKVWNGMLRRSYDTAFKQKQSTYLECSVADEWLVFSNFHKWMIEQPYECMHLDKDILVQGNKVYSKETCCFVPQFINGLLWQKADRQRELPLGVSLKYNRPQAGPPKRPYSCAMATENSKANWVGNFETAEEAHYAWQIKKADMIGYRVMRWQFDPEVNHSFNQKVAMALFDRADMLRNDAANGRETLTY